MTKSSTVDVDDSALNDAKAPLRLGELLVAEGLIAMAKLREGRTTLDEVLRVLPPSALRELRSTVT